MRIAAEQLQTGDHADLKTDERDDLRQGDDFGGRQARARQRLQIVRSGLARPRREQIGVLVSCVEAGDAGGRLFPVECLDILG